MLERVLLNDKNFQCLLKENDAVNDYCSIVDKRPPTANDSAHVSPPILEASTAEEYGPKYVAKAIKLSLMSNWGHKHIIGLTGVLKYNNKWNFIINYLCCSILHTCSTKAEPIN